MNNKIKKYFSEIHNSLFITSQLFLLGLFFLIYHFIMAGKSELTFQWFNLISMLVSFFLSVYLYNKKCDLRKNVTYIEKKYLIFGFVGFLLFIIPVAIFFSRKM